MGADKPPVDSMLKSLRRIVQEVVSAPDLPETLAIIVRRVRR
jgi:signal transduction protein with GAF and PtsI domain